MNDPDTNILQSPIRLALYSTGQHNVRTRRAKILHHDGKHTRRNSADPKYARRPGSVRRKCPRKRKRSHPPTLARLLTGDIRRICLNGDRRRGLVVRFFDFVPPAHFEILGPSAPRQDDQLSHNKSYSRLQGPSILYGLVPH